MINQRLISFKAVLTQYGLKVLITFLLYTKFLGLFVNVNMSILLRKLGTNKLSMIMTQD